MPPSRSTPADAPPTSLDARPSPWPARLALLAIMALAAGLRLWHLDQNGYGRQYYAAGVRSMLQSFHCFFYNCFDPGGFVSIDKPPVALWAQVLSAKVLGFGAFSLMFTQVLEGLVAVALIHRLVARRFGATAGLVAALCLALTPISVAGDRSNNTESCLIMVLLLAAWATIRAIETARARYLVLAMALVGVGFNVKMAAALIVAPTFALAYLLATPQLPLRQRLTHLAGAMGILAAVSLSWVTAFDLTPQANRPYAGSTRHNSMLELALMHNGLDRFMPRRKPQGADADMAANADREAAMAAAASNESAPLWDQTPTGPLRLLTPLHSAQMNWWMPLVLLAVALGGFQWRAVRHLELTVNQANLLIWSGWALGYTVIFSFAGGVFHTYYLAIVAPPLAALAGIGWAALWERCGKGAWRRALPIALVATALWQLYINQDYLHWAPDDWRVWALAASSAALLLTGAALLALPQRWMAGLRLNALAGLGLLAMMVMPIAWSLSTVLVRPNVAAPVANLAVLGSARHDDATAPATAEARLAARARGQKLIQFLQNRVRDERFLVAVPNTFLAAPIILRTGEPVMAMGGYLGRDPILTPAALERMVANGEVRFVMLGGFSLVGKKTPHELALAQWVVAHGERVDPALWRDGPVSAPQRSAGARSRYEPAELFDLRPDSFD